MSYHISPAGLRRCTAVKGNCPYAKGGSKWDGIDMDSFGGHRGNTSHLKTLLRKPSKRNSMSNMPEAVTA